MSCANQNSYDIGDGVKLHGDFTNPETGNPSDPINPASCTVRKPDGTETIYTVADTEFTRLSTGIYICDIVVDQAGDWFYRWVGETQAQEERRFYVKAGVVTAPQFTFLKGAIVMAAKRTAVKKCCAPTTAAAKRAAAAAQAFEEGQCDYTEQTAATNAYNEALRAEETACTSVETAEAALADAQGAYDAASANYETAKVATDEAKVVLDETYDNKRPQLL